MAEKSSAFINRISREYALYVLKSGRAIPSLYDGLKSSQRIALWLMEKKAEAKKTASLVGSMIESLFYLHGENSAADMVCGLAAPFLNNTCLLDPVGGFGTKVEPRVFSSPRYTSVERSEFAEKNLYVDTDLLPQMENYDGSGKMPFTYAPLLPLVLLNGIEGIAIGFATRILPRSFEQIKKATLEYMKTGKIKFSLIPTFVQYDCKVTKVLGEVNKYQIEGKVERVSERVYRVTELLPGMSSEKLRENLIELMEPKLRKDGTVLREACVEDFVDNSQKEINLEVTFCPGILPKHKEELNHMILRMLGLVTTETENLTVLDMTGPLKMESPEKIVEQFVEWRLSLYGPRYERLRDREQLEMLFWESFRACLKQGVATRLNKIKNKSDLKSEIVAAIEKAKLGVLEEVVERLAVLPLYRWTQSGLEECDDKIKECEKLATEYDMISKKPEKQREIYMKEVQAL